MQLQDTTLTPLKSKQWYESYIYLGTRLSWLVRINILRLFQAVYLRGDGAEHRITIPQESIEWRDDTSCFHHIVVRYINAL